MRAEIELPGGFRAILDHAGEWTCEEPACLELLREIAEDFGAQFYLSDPFGERLRGTLATIPGARLVREELPPADPLAGIDDSGRLVVH